MKSAPTGDVKLSILDHTGAVVRDLTATKEKGINRVQWDLRASRWCNRRAEVVAVAAADAEVGDAGEPSRKRRPLRLPAVVVVEEGLPAPWSILANTLRA